MKVFKIDQGENNEWILPEDSEDWQTLTFDGKEKASTWKPVKVRLLKYSSERKLKLISSDFPTGSGSHILALSGNAKRVLENKLRKYGEFLPLICSEGEFWIFNVTSFVDALDDANTVGLRNSQGDEFLTVKKFIFKPERLKDALIFKISQKPRGTNFVTNQFIEMYEASGLTGLECCEVWPSDKRPFKF